MSLPGQILLYDGTCGFCAASVQFILRHEHQQTLGFAPLQGELAAGVQRRHPELAGVDSLVWIEGAGTSAERVLVRSEAVLRSASYLGRHWNLLQAGRILPAGVRDAVYDFIARHRHKVMGTAEVCYVPPPEVRARFFE
ncbi:MAG: DCC1-like thiol-disulfide oxidoreductase family protein [Vicinamibacterales bacterium]